ncbi:MAG: RraA family protein [Anaerolineae bacterium]|jgi:regulator of RNase E activity RraA
MKFNNREDIIQLTPLWKGERFEDGRPKVSDEVIARLRRLNIVLEEAWAVCWSHGYHYQFEGNWLNMHPEMIVIGRAVTGTFVPTRPDLHDYLMSYGQEQEGRIGAMNSWVIETLRTDDVIVIDLFGKVAFGTYSGANLSTAIATRTGGTAQVIDGGIRDAQQIVEIPGFNTFCRGMDPTPIRDVTLIGLNTPCRIGNATCMPGDLVIGTYEGVLFVPPHLAEEVLEHAERTHQREQFSHQRLREGVYTSSQMDTKWTEAIEADFDAWRQTHGIDTVSFEGRTAADEAQSSQETLL